jgi:hypothetical protein
MPRLPEGSGSEECMAQYHAGPPQGPELSAHLKEVAWNVYGATPPLRREDDVGRARMASGCPSTTRNPLSPVLSVRSAGRTPPRWRVDGYSARTRHSTVNLRVRRSIPVGRSHPLRRVLPRQVQSVHIVVPGNSRSTANRCSRRPVSLSWYSHDQYLMIMI